MIWIVLLSQIPTSSFFDIVIGSDRILIIMFVGLFQCILFIDCGNLYRNVFSIGMVRWTKLQTIPNHCMHLTFILKACIAMRNTPIFLMPFSTSRQKYQMDQRKWVGKAFAYLYNVLFHIIYESCEKENLTSLVAIWLKYNNTQWHSLCAQFCFNISTSRLHGKNIPNC